MSKRDDDHVVLNASDEAWQTALFAADLFASAPQALGGIVVAGRPGPVREAWLTYLRARLGAAAPVVTLPRHATDQAINGGLDLARTLASGRPVNATGLFGRADGGVLLVPGAERLPAGTLAQLTAALDRSMQGVADGALPPRLAVVAYDESLPDEDGLADALIDRLSLRISLDAVHPATLGAADDGGQITIAPPADLTTSRDMASREDEAPCVRPGDVAVANDHVSAICGLAMSLGIGSLRPPLQALAVARAHAALNGRHVLDESDLEAAARLALAWRAQCLPAPPDSQDTDAEDTEDTEAPEPQDQSEDQSEDPPPQPPPDDPTQDDNDRDSQTGSLEDRLIETARACLPADLLAQIAAGQQRQRQPATAGTSGAVQKSLLRGARKGVVRGDPRRGAQLSVFATLLAAAPRQTLRQADAGRNRNAQVQVRPDDFRVYVKQQKRQSLTIFAVDASGSSALHRLGEAKGAIELLLADCYVRRDQIALIAFRGAGAQVLLPPTSALARARRLLSVLPGGGGTPLASGLAAALELALASKRRGLTPSLVLLTDGRANVAKDGAHGRAKAQAEAEAEAGRFRQIGVTTLLLDTSPRPDARTAEFAKALDARYLPLPKADSQRIRKAVAASGLG